jgi:ADP-ribose pyrophosphatase
MKNNHSKHDHKLLWKEISRQSVFKKFSRGIDRVNFKLPDGKTYEYYIKHEPDTVCTLAISKNNKIILVRQFRPGPKKILLTLPGGGITSNEDPKSVAVRELVEETGCKGDINLVATFYSDGYSMSKRYCFLAVNCIFTNIPEPDTTEFLDVVELSVVDFIKELRNGNITDPEAAYVAIDHILKVADINDLYGKLARLLKQSMRILD